MKHIIPLILTLALLGCQTPPANVATPVSIASHTPVPTIAPPNAEQSLRADVIAQIQTDLHYQSPYVQALEAVSGMSIPETCADFAVKLSAFEENLTAQQFRVSAAGICYVTTADGTIIVDAWDNDGPLFLSPAIASQALGVEVARVSADGRYGSIGDAYNAKDERVGGVSRFTMQWEKVNADGVLPSEADPSSVPPTPVNPEQSNLYRVNYAPAIDAEAQAQAIQALVGDYMSGKLKEVSGLNSEQHAAFSKALAEKRNAETGINFVSFTYLDGKEYFLNPKTLQPEEMPTNVSDKFRQENSFTIYSEVKFDAQGNVMFQYNGKWRTVPNSAGFDFSMEIADPNDPRIEFPKTPTITEGEFAGLTGLQRGLVREEFGGTDTIKPVVPIKDDLGEIIFKAGKAFKKMSTFPIITFETDGQGKPTLAKVSLVIAGGGYGLYEEGRDTEIRGSSLMRDYETFWKTLEDGQIYYLAVANNPQSAIDYASHMSGENIEGIYLGHGKSNDVPIVVGSSFIKPKD